MRCPECRDGLNVVVKTTKSLDDVMRQRKCVACGHTWFTQELLVKARIASRIEVTADVE